MHHREREAVELLDGREGGKRPIAQFCILVMILLSDGSRRQLGAKDAGWNYSRQCDITSFEI